MPVITFSNMKIFRLNVILEKPALQFCGRIYDDVRGRINSPYILSHIILRLSTLLELDPNQDIRK